MDDLILLRAGNREGMPTLADRELVYARDENALYIGTPDGNRQVGGVKKVAAQEHVEPDAPAEAIYTAFNSLVDAMKAAGLMETK